ncbi:MAG: hypothetical protein ACI392_08990 [Paludibacteraceae bacterium]
MVSKMFAIYMLNANLSYWRLFFVPMYYNFSIRLTRIDKVFSWLFINLLPTFFFALCVVKSITWQHVLATMLLWIAVYTLYEFGYIYNDVKAIEREKNPTLRLTAEQLTFAHKHFWLIFISRLLFFAFALAGVYCLFPTKNSLVTIVLACICPLLFYVYNLWRSETNVWLYFWLVVSRFVPFVWLFECDQNVLLTLLIVLVYPCEIAVERFSRPQKRFSLVARFIPDEHSKTTFRVFYYASCCLALGLANMLGYLDFILTMPFVLFLLYRVVLYIKLH